MIIILKQTYLLPLHDLRQSVRFVLGWEGGQIYFLLLQSLIVEPHSEHSKQPVVVVGGDQMG